MLGFLNSDNIESYWLPNCLTDLLFTFLNASILAVSKATFCASLSTLLLLFNWDSKFFAVEDTWINWLLSSISLFLIFSSPEGVIFPCISAIRVWYFAINCVICCFVCSTTGLAELLEKTDNFCNLFNSLIADVIEFLYPFMPAFIDDKSLSLVAEVFSVIYCSCCSKEIRLE